MSSLSFSLFFAIQAFFICILPANALPSSGFKKDLLKSQGILTQSTKFAALGRESDLGDLYGAKSDNFAEIPQATDSAGNAIHSSGNAVVKSGVHLDGKGMNSFPVKQKEYIFLKDLSGQVIIIDANSYEGIIRYKMLEISYSVVAIVNGTFYNIDTLNGIIMSAPVEEIIREQSTRNWTHVGSFPPEEKAIYNSAIANNSVIYFVTYSGVLYSYDTTSKTVTKISSAITGISKYYTFDEDGYYASLVIMNDILYIYRYVTFYSFDGTTVRSIKTSKDRTAPGLFQYSSFVCLVGGGSGGDVGINPDPVSCYNPNDKTWADNNFINEWRRFPGITSTKSGIYIFGGWAAHASSPNRWINSVEVFNPNTNIWSYIPSPLENAPEYVQPVTFYF